MGGCYFLGCFWGLWWFLQLLETQLLVKIWFCIQILHFMGFVTNLECQFWPVFDLFLTSNRPIRMATHPWPGHPKITQNHRFDRAFSFSQVCFWCFYPLMDISTFGTPKTYIYTPFTDLHFYHSLLSVIQNHVQNTLKSPKIWSKNRVLFTVSECNCTHPSRGTSKHLHLREIPTLGFYDFDTFIDFITFWYPFYIIPDIIFIMFYPNME